MQQRPKSLGRRHRSEHTILEKGNSQGVGDGTVG